MFISPVNLTNADTASLIGKKPTDSMSKFADMVGSKEQSVSTLSTEKKAPMDLDTNKIVPEVHLSPIEGAKLRSRMKTEDQTVTGAAIQNQKKSGLIANVDMFLKIFLTQLKGQNPMNPSKPEDITQQLAQFSQVEQALKMVDHQEETNAIQRRMLANNNLGYLNNQVMFQGNTIQWNGSAVEFEYELSDEAKGASVFIKDSTNGRVMAAFDGFGTPGRHHVAWDGKDPSGTVLPKGNYTLEVLEHLDENQEKEAVAFVRGRVETIDYDNSGAASLQINGETVLPQNVIRLYSQQEKSPPHLTHRIFEEAATQTNDHNS